MEVAAEPEAARPAGPVPRSGSRKDSAASKWSHAPSEPAEQAAPKSMFADAESMKARLRASATRPKYDVAIFYKNHGFAQMVARSQKFEYTTLSVIAFNALWISIDTDNNGAAILLDAHPVFQIAEHFFCAYFTFEWTIRFVAFQRKRNGLRDPWFVFDSFMVFMMVSETWVMTSDAGRRWWRGCWPGERLSLAAAPLAAPLKDGADGEAAAFHARAPDPDQRDDVRNEVALFHDGAPPHLIYVFAIAFRQLTDGSPVGVLYFRGMVTAMHTLLIDGTFLDSAGSVVKELEKESIAYVVMFYVFVLLSALTVMNMLIGVLCEVVTAVASAEREQITVGVVKDGFMDIIAQGGLDTDGNGMISKAEFEAILDNPSATRLLARVEVDVMALVDLADFIFTNDDPADQDGERQLSFGEFMDIVLSLRGCNQAMVKDIVDLRKYIRGSFYGLEERIKERTRSNVSEARHSSSLLARQEKESTPTLDDSKEVAQEAKASEPLWIQTVRLEGILTAANLEVQRFLDNLSQAPAISSRPLTGSSGSEGSGGHSLRPAGSLERIGDAPDNSLAMRLRPMRSRSGLSVHVPDPMPGFACADGRNFEYLQVEATTLTPSTRAPSEERKCSRHQDTLQEEAKDFPEFRARLGRLGQALVAGLRDLQSFRDVV
eukprot:CAMPEP_0179041654 /NCGR_PEP_ID=MMETSP0796-20121207/16267_1 /TAXON_ID=73915 /ORGANISM="Pyrodinium bahamense, Strain pbaha01" /LENGTH=660 /DNA_ID=CAMNT_0020738023 /DNA_START=47 /DNA_END=2030 /DNA_ORIENTATION=+